MTGKHAAAATPCRIAIGVIPVALVPDTRMNITGPLACENLQGRDLLKAPAVLPGRTLVLGTTDGEHAGLLRPAFDRTHDLHRVADLLVIASMRVLHMTTVDHDHVIRIEQLLDAMAGQFRTVVQVTSAQLVDVHPVVEVAHVIGLHKRLTCRRRGRDPYARYPSGPSSRNGLPTAPSHVSTRTGSWNRPCRADCPAHRSSYTSSCRSIRS